MKVGVYMNKKVVIIGGGTGMSILLRGLKQFPLDITAIVSVCDSGRNTGMLREEFNIPAVGDIRKVLISLSETEPLVEKLLSYQFDKDSSLNGHKVGNILLTATKNITGNISDGIEALGKVLNLKGKVVPLTEDVVTLVGEMEDGTILENEHIITKDTRAIKNVYYKEEPEVTKEALKAIKEADLIILSMGSIYTSILPNLICKEIVEEIEKSKAKIMYVCNMMTQPGETEGYKVSDHVSILNKYLGQRNIDIVLANNGYIDSKLIEKYSIEEQKDPVIVDPENIKKLNVKLIQDNFVDIVDNVIRHNTIKIAFHVFSSLF